MKRETPPFNPNGEYAGLNKPLYQIRTNKQDVWVDYPDSRLINGELPDFYRKHFDWRKTETQTEREARCHTECEAYYTGLPMTEQDRVWLHRGIEAGAKWIEGGDRI